MKRYCVIKYVPIVTILAIAMAAQSSAWHLSPSANAPRVGDDLTLTAVSSAVFDSTACDISAAVFGKSHKVKYRFRSADTSLVEMERGTVRTYRLDGDNYNPADERKPGHNMPADRRFNTGGFFPYGQNASSFYYYREGEVGEHEHLSDRGVQEFAEIGLASLTTPDIAIDNSLLVKLCRRGVMTVGDSSQIVRSDNGRYILNDSSLIMPVLTDSVLLADSVTYSETVSRWYALGYRYPIVEKREYTVKRFGAICDSRTETYYCSPLTQEEEIDNDEINDSIRQSLGDMRFGPLGAGHQGHISPKNTVPKRGMEQSGESDDGDVTENISDGNEFTVAVCPTEVSDKTEISVMSSDAGSATVLLVSSQGKAMWQKKLEYPSGGFRLTVPTADLIRGEYIVVVNSGENLSSTKIFKK